MNDKKLSIIEFNTKKSSYIFDGVTSEVIPSDDVINYIIKNFYNYSSENLFNSMTEKGLNTKREEFDTKYKHVKIMIESGMFYIDINNNLHNNINPKEIINDPSQAQLILILTEMCNLRCKYCIYSDEYPDEVTYTNDHMTLETAKKAIDLYFEIYEKRKLRGLNKRPSITFYGGEPLLEFKLIKEIVCYAENINKDIKFNFTTNGVLLNDEMISFFLLHDIDIAFSLDGFKENHNRNRITITGKDTFDNIISNISRLQEVKKQKNIEKNITFICCYDTYTDINKCIEFFEDNFEKFKPFSVLFNAINSCDTTYFKKLDEEMKNKQGIITFSESMKKVKERFFDKKHENDRFREIAKSLFLRDYTIINRFKGGFSPFGGSCKPSGKMCVSPSGDIFPCEKVNKKFAFGNVKSGLDEKKIIEITNVLIKNELCGISKVCEYKSLCQLCYAFFNGDKSIKKEFCQMQKDTIPKGLSNLYSRLEEDPHIEELFDLSKVQYDVLSENN